MCLLASYSESVGWVESKQSNKYDVINQAHVWSCQQVHSTECYHCKLIDSDVVMTS